MYGVLGEDESDAEALKVLIRGLKQQASLKILALGYSGGGELLAKGSRQLKAFAAQGCDRFVVCHDADGTDPDAKRAEIMRRVIDPSGLVSSFCVVIPVQEFEAWILADLEAVSQVIPSWRPGPFKENPESIRNPKERLKWESRKQNKKPRYDPATHNPQIAKYLQIDRLRQRCPSFERLARFVTQPT